MAENTERRPGCEACSDGTWTFEFVDGGDEVTVVTEPCGVCRNEQAANVRTPVNVLTDPQVDLDLRTLCVALTEASQRQDVIGCIELVKAYSDDTQFWRRLAGVACCWLGMVCPPDELERRRGLAVDEYLAAVGGGDAR